MNLTLLTRPYPDSQSMASDLLKHGIECFIEPMLRVDFAGPNQIIDDCDYIVLTSKNAARYLIAGNYSKTIGVVCVGEGTASLVRGGGYNNVYTCSGNVGEVVDFCRTSLSCNDRIIYLRGERVTEDLSCILSSELGFSRVLERVVYSTVPRQGFSAKLHELFLEGAIESVVLCSQFTAETFRGIVKHIGLSLANVNLFCFSKKIEAVVVGMGSRQVFCSDMPKIDSMVNLIINVLQR